MPFDGRSYEFVNCAAPISPGSLGARGVPLEADFGVGFAVNDPQAAIERTADRLPAGSILV